MLDYEIYIEDEKVILEIKNKEKVKCKYCSSNTRINEIYKAKLNTKKIFYDGFTREVFIKYRYFLCKCCNKKFAEESAKDIKIYLFNTKKDVERKVLEVLFKNSML